MKIVNYNTIFSAGRKGEIFKKKDSEFKYFIWIFLFSIVLSIINILTDGNIIISAAVPLILIVVLLSFYRLDIGFSMFVGMVLLFDQFFVHGFEPVTAKVYYFVNLKQNPYLPSFEAGVFTPMELHLMLLVIIWIIHVAVRKDTELIPIKIWFPAIIFFIWILFSFVYGQIRGGSFLSALWEVRALFYLCVMYFFVPQIIQTKKQLETLLWFCIGAISIKALQGVVRFIMLGFQFGGFDELTNSEDPIFFITLFVLLIALTLFGGNEKQRRTLLYLLPVLVLGFFVGQRRASYASFLVTMISFIFLLPKKYSLRLFKYLGVFIIVFCVYMAFFWNSPSEFGLLAQKIKSMFYVDPTKTSARDYSSNLYREFENYNLSMTIRHSPFLGIGFGNKYEQWLSFWGLEDLGLLSYIPHNSILWLFSKTGSYGFFTFFFFINTFIFYASSLLKKTDDPYLKAVSVMVILAVINQLVVVFVEMHLSFYRTMIYLGVLMGLMSVICELKDKSLEKFEENKTKN